MAKKKAEAVDQDQQAKATEGLRMVLRPWRSRQTPTGAGVRVGGRQYWVSDYVKPDRADRFELLLAAIAGMVMPRLKGGEIIKVVLPNGIEFLIGVDGVVGELRREQPKLKRG
jgi:hypothetical protein